MTILEQCFFCSEKAIDRIGNIAYCKEHKEDAIKGYYNPAMTPKRYQEQASRTLISEPDVPLSGHETMIIWNAVGLAGEAGEVVDHIKKGIFHRHGLDHEKLEKELGDVLWYVAALCTTLGFDMEIVMQKNIDKLLARYPNGYNSTDSINRPKE